jgi:hypothetical protein
VTPTEDRAARLYQQKLLTRIRELETTNAHLHARATAAERARATAEESTRRAWRISAATGTRTQGRRHGTTGD